MGIGVKSATVVVVVAVAVGFLVAKRLEIFPRDGTRGPAVTPAATPGGPVRSSVRVRELRILGPDESVSLSLRESAEGSPGLRMTNTRKTAVIEAGVHGNGYPFLLVSDGAVRNFGLGRVDGIQASPILVFRTDDVVRMVFGLSMTEAKQPPFLVQYTGDGQKHDVIGRYCDRPDRVCVR
jgi:hypothetical protein